MMNSRGAVKVTLWIINIYIQHTVNLMQYLITEVEALRMLRFM